MNQTTELDAPSGVGVDAIVGQMHPVPMIDGTHIGVCPECGAELRHFRGDETAPCPRCGTDWLCDVQGRLLGPV